MSNDPNNRWDPPEYLAVTERLFLENRASTLHHIQQAAYLSMAQVLDQVRTKFRDDPKVDGWFWRWIEEATPLNKATAERLLAIGKALKEEPDLAELTNKYTKTAAAFIAKLPPKSRSKVVQELIAQDFVLTTKQLSAVNDLPEVELERAEELVQQLQTTIAKAQLRAATAGTSQDRQNAKQQAAASDKRLQIALERLFEARAKVSELERTNSSRDNVEAALRAQIREQQVKLEEMSIDPQAKRKRAVAKTLVDAANGLDLLLSSLDKYQVDREDLGEEATRALERKMSLVQAKLLEVQMRET